MDYFKSLPPYLQISLAAIFIILVVVIVFYAFRQGREISVWPPKVGPKPDPKGPTQQPYSLTPSTLVTPPELPSTSLQQVPAPESRKVPDFAAQGTREVKLTLKRYNVKRRITQGDYFEFNFPPWDFQNHFVRIKASNIKTLTINGQERNVAHLNINFSPAAPYLTLRAGENVQQINDVQFIVPEDPDINYSNGVHTFSVGPDHFVFFYLHIDNVNTHTRDIDVKFTKTNNRADNGGADQQAHSAARLHTAKQPGEVRTQFGHRMGSGSLSLPSLVAEIQYDHYSGSRFRHGEKFHWWRPDKKAESCKAGQVRQ